MIETPRPNTLLPLDIMEPVCKEDGIDPETMPTALRTNFKKMVTWGWGYDGDLVNRHYQYYWASREGKIICLITAMTRYSGPLRQSFLRFKGGEWQWADIIDPEIQDLITRWVILGKMAGSYAKEEP